MITWLRTPIWQALVVNVAWIVYIIRSTCRSEATKSRVLAKVQSEQDEVNKTVGKFNEDLDNLKIRMECLINNQPNQEQEITKREAEVCKIKKEILNLIEEKSKVLRDDILLEYNSHVAILKSSYEIAMKKYANETDVLKEEAGRTRLEVKSLKERLDRCDTLVDKMEIKSDEMLEENLKQLKSSYKEKFDEFVKESGIWYNDALNSIEKRQMLNTTRLSELEVEINNRLKVELAPLKNLEESPTNTNPNEPIAINWTLPNFRKSLQALMDDRSYVHHEFFKIRKDLRVKPTLTFDNKERVFRIRLEFDKDAKTSRSAFLHYRNFTLLDQRGGHIQEDLQMVDRPGFTSFKTMMAPYFTDVSLCAETDLALDSRYVRDDQIVIKMVFEPLAYVTDILISNTGCFRWQIGQYTKRKEEAIRGTRKWVVSEPFRTSDAGYHVQVEACLNGAVAVGGEGDVFVAFRARFILGNMDRLLEHPVRGVFTVSLLDCSDSEEKEPLSFKHEEGLAEVYRKRAEAESDVKEDNAEKWCIDTVFLRSVVENEKYLVNDTITLDMVVVVE